MKKIHKARRISFGSDNCVSSWRNWIMNVGHDKTTKRYEQNTRKRMTEEKEEKKTRKNRWKCLNCCVAATVEYDSLWILYSISTTTENVYTFNKRLQRAKKSFSFACTHTVCVGQLATWYCLLDTYNIVHMHLQ